MYLYWIRQQKLFDPDIGAYVSFGIGAWKIGFDPKPLLFIPDVSTDGKAVLKLAVRCTLGRLDPQQLVDVVEDFIC